MVRRLRRHLRQFPEQLPELRGLDRPLQRRSAEEFECVPRRSWSFSRLKTAIS